MFKKPKKISVEDADIPFLAETKAGQSCGGCGHKMEHRLCPYALYCSRCCAVSYNKTSFLPCHSYKSMYESSERSWQELYHELEALRKQHSMAWAIIAVFFVGLVLMALI